MAVRDTERWAQNDDGSWSRKIGENEETTYVNPNATQGALDAATEHGVDINAIEGSGKDGKVTKADVEATLSES